MPANKCPCDSKRLFDHCCGAILNGRVIAETAEALMRSRYTAYTLGHTNYLLETWCTENRPASLTMDESQKWLGLKIKSCEAGLPGDREGIVEFVARYKIDGRAHRLHEFSRFQKIDGAWIYVDGELKSK